MSFFVPLWLAAFVSAVTLPDRPVGVGLLVISSAFALTIAWRLRTRLSPRDLAVGALGWTLTVPCVFITADWVLALNFLGAAGIGAVAATRAVAWAEVFSSGFRVLRSLWRGLGLSLAPVSRVVVARRKLVLSPAARGTAFGLVAMALFGGLFASADAAFAQLARDAFIPDWEVGLLPARIAIGLGVLGAGGAYVVAADAPRKERWSWNDPFSSGFRSLARAEWVPGLVLLNALFATFVVVQVRVLFGGRTHVLETAGLTYAQYARQGFFQLLAVAALTLGVVAVTVYRAERRDGHDRLLLRFLLGTLCGLTLVVLASAFKRLDLYEQTYGYTRLRVFIDLVIMWLGAVFVLVMVAGGMWRARWLPRTVVAVSAIALLAFSALNPDAFIARRNVERYFATGKIDVGYLSSLSGDAVAVLATLPQPARRCALASLHANVERSTSLWTFNFARNRAIEALDATKFDGRGCYLLFPLAGISVGHVGASLAR